MTVARRLSPHSAGGASTAGFAETEDVAVAETEATGGGGAAVSDEQPIARAVRPIAAPMTRADGIARNLQRRDVSRKHGREIVFA